MVKILKSITGKLEIQIEVVSLEILRVRLTFCNRKGEEIWYSQKDILPTDTVHVDGLIMKFDAVES